MDDLEKQIIGLLKEGKTQKEVSEIFKLKGITPNSLSIIEKRLKKIRTIYGAKTNFHLAILLTTKK